MLGIGFVLFIIAILGALCYAMKESGASSARVSDMEKEIQEFTKAMKKDKEIREKVASSRPADINSVIDEL